MPRKHQSVDTPWAELSLGERIRHLEVEGYVVLPGLLSSHLVSQLRGELAGVPTQGADYTDKNKCTTTSNGRAARSPNCWRVHAFEIACVVRKYVSGWMWIQAIQRSWVTRSSDVSTSAPLSVTSTIASKPNFSFASQNG